MNEVDLRDVFDDCFGGYEDHTEEISLKYDKEKRFSEKCREITKRLNMGMGGMQL